MDFNTLTPVQRLVAALVLLFTAPNEDAASQAGQIVGELLQMVDEEVLEAHGGKDSIAAFASQVVDLSTNNFFVAKANEKGGVDIEVCDSEEYRDERLEEEGVYIPTKSEIQEYIIRIY